MKQVKKPKSVKDLKPGDSAVVSGLHSTGALKKRLLDMGITPGVDIKIVKIAPLGDPIEICLRGYRLSMRKADARLIEITQGEGDDVCRQKR